MSFRMKDAADKALPVLRADPEFALFETDGELINAVLVKHAAILGKYFLRSDIDAATALLASVGRGGAVSRIRAPKEEGKKQSKEETLMERGRQLCELVEGEVEGESCRYTKHELTAGGYCESYEVVVPLPQMTQDLVEGQYSPSREEFLAEREKES